MILGNKEEAILAYEKSIKLNPNHMYAYINLAKVQLEIGDIDGALLNLENARVLDVNNKYVQEQIRELQTQIKEQPKEVELSITKTAENEENK
jgi:tetratricopeptide (TPR) repeat protein